VSLTFSQLRDRPEFCTIAAHRMWKAWWEYYSHPLEKVENHLKNDIADAAQFPFGIVAHDDETYIGHCLAIAHDLDQRPDLSPWIAALWVEPDHRRKGIAAQLMSRAMQELQALGYKTIYINAKPSLKEYYPGLGWMLIDQNQGPDQLDVFVRNSDLNVQAR